MLWQLIPRILNAALAMAVFLSASLPCGFGPPAADPVRAREFAAAGGSGAHAHREGAAEATSSHADMPCHGATSEQTPPPELARPCPCGCGDRAAGGGAGLSRLPVAVLLPALEPASPARAPVPPVPVCEGAPGFASPPDVVPWA